MVKDPARKTKIVKGFLLILCIKNAIRTVVISIVTVIASTYAASILAELRKVRITLTMAINNLTFASSITLLAVGLYNLLVF